MNNLMNPTRLTFKNNAYYKLRAVFIIMLLINLSSLYNNNFMY